METEALDTKTRVSRRISLFREASAGALARRAIAGALACAMLPLSLGTAAAQYQEAPPPPPDYGNGAPAPAYGAPSSAYQPLPPEQLDSLVAPIALYPDSLVAQILAGATYPAQLNAAEQFEQANGGYPPQQLAEMANTQPWDPSVKALVAFPQVLSDLNRNMEWTTQLGNAYYNQPQDVLGAVQSMRQRAYAAGSLRPTPQLAVTYEPGDILIAPVSPTVVYVPYYDPWVVYGAPVPVYPHYYWGPPRGVAFGTGLAIGFGVGIAVAAFTHYSWGYHSWRPDWHDRTVVYNHTTYVSNSVTVINHGHYGAYERSPQAREFDHAQAARFEGNRTINNVTINRGGNTYSRGGSTLNNGANTYNRGAQTYNRGPLTYNTGANTYNRGAQTYNRGPQTYNTGANTYNRGVQTYNRGDNPAYNRAPEYKGATGGAAQPYNHPNYAAQPNTVARPSGNYGAYNQGARPQGENHGEYRGGQGGERGAQPQQHSAPAREFHGGGHEEHSGGHEDHHR